LAEQGKIVGFLTNTENVQMINGLVEDIHNAIIVTIFTFSLIFF